MIHEREVGWTGDDGGTSLGATSTTTFSDGSTQTLEGVSPGQHYLGQPGEKIKEFSPNVPNPEFFPHVRLMLTLVGVNLGIPLVLLLMDASQTNFSGWRGAVDQAKLGFRRNQRWLIGKLHIPVYQWKVRQWLGDDKIAQLKRAGINAFGHIWNPPTWEYVEPLKDASAELVQQRNLLKSPRRIQAGRGCNWDDVSTEFVEDYAQVIIKAKIKAEEINAQFQDEPISWRECISLFTPDNVSVSIQSEADSAADQGDTASGSQPSQNGNGRLSW